MGERVLPTVQALSQVVKNVSREGRGESRTTLRKKGTKAQEDNKGSKAGGGGAAY